MLEAVRSIVVDVSDGRGLGLVTPDVSFERELGLGSLERVELAVRAGDAFGVHLSEEAFGTVDTPRQLLAHLQSLRAESPAVAAPSVTAESKRALLPGVAPLPPPVDATTLVEVLEYHVRHQPDRVHVVLEDDDGAAVPITYRALHRAAMAVAQGLRARGIERGRCIAIMLPTGLGYLASFMGVLLAGGVPVPLYPPVRLDRIAEYMGRCAKILDNAQAQMLVTFDRAARVADLARDRVAAIEHVLSIDSLLVGEAASITTNVAVTATDTALIQYTSGSTGDPKGVELTHANVMANIRASSHGCGLAADDIIVSWLPLYHDMGLIGGWLMPLYFGVPSVLMSPMAFLSRPIRWLAALSDYQATKSVAPNFAFDVCVKRIDEDAIAALDLHRIRAILNGSEPILPATLDRFVERFAPTGLRREVLFCAYGLAENMVAVAFPPVGRAPRVDRIDRKTFEGQGLAIAAPDGDDVLEFVGVGSAVQDHEVIVVDPDGKPVPERHQGVVRFRGPSSFKGYFRRPDATAEVQFPDGWVDTGDLGYFAEGELFIVGRLKDLIIKGGRNYYPHEIEEAAAKVEGIRLGCVSAFAVRDDAAGTEQIVVVAETREREPLAREMLVGKVIESVTSRVGVPPDRVVLVAPGVVPKTSSGKIQRRESKRLYVEDLLDKGHGSFARQALGLYLRGLPSRAWQLAVAIGRAVYGAWAIGAIFTTGFVSLVLARVWPAGPGLRRLAAFESSLALTLAGLRPRCTGLEKIPKGAAIFVANHCGYLDFLICGATLPADARFVVKGELRSQPLVGTALARIGHVFLDRHTTTRALADLDVVNALLKSGQRIILFPEGTFSPDVGMRPFKLGAFRLACESGVPIVPIAIRGSRKALRDGTWLPRHEQISVEVLDPIRVEGTEIADIVRLRDATADAIAEHIEEPRLFAADISVPGAT